MKAEHFGLICTIESFWEEERGKIDWEEKMLSDCVELTLNSGCSTVDRDQYLGDNIRGCSWLKYQKKGLHDGKRSYYLDMDIFCERAAFLAGKRTYMNDT